MTLGFSAIQTAGLFGIGYFSRSAPTGGVGWGRMGEQWHLIYCYHTAINDMLPAGALDDDDSSIVIPIDLVTGVDTTWYITRRAVGVDGVMSDYSPAMTIEIEAGGDVVEPVGNIPYDVAATAKAEGNVLVTWKYNPDEEPATPTGFLVYRVGTPDELVATVAYSAYTFRLFHERRYETQVGPYVHDAEEEFYVKAYRTEGAQTYYGDASDSASVMIDAQGPTAIDNITVSIVA